MPFGRKAHTTSNTTADGRPAGHARKSPLALLASLWALINLLLFVVITALAAHLVDKYFDGAGAVTSIFTSPATIATLFFALLAGSVGMATNLFSFLHLAHWSESSRLSSLSSNMITLALTWLAAGFACRSIRENSFRVGGKFGAESKALAALLIIAMLPTLMHVINLGLFHHEDNRVGYNNNTGAGVAGGSTLPHHHKTVGTHNNAAPMGAHNNNAGMVGDNRAAIA